MFGHGGDTIDLCAAAQGEAEVAVVIGGQVPVLAAGHDHEDELVLLARLGHPDDACAFAGALVDHLHAAETLIEGDAGVEIGDVQGQMGQGRAHGVLLCLSA